MKFKKKDIVELAITAVLVAVFFFLIADSFRRRGRKKSAEVGSDTAPLERDVFGGKELFPDKGGVGQYLSGQKTLWGMLNEETANLEVSRDPFSSVSSKGVDLELSGIIWDKDNPRAVIDGEIVGIGGKIGPNTVMGIEPDRVVVYNGTEQRELRLEQ